VCICMCVFLGVGVHPSKKTGFFGCAIGNLLSLATEDPTERQFAFLATCHAVDSTNAFLSIATLVIQVRL
jgi:hypothetical protein